jgi:hypothetical protein
MIIVWLVLLGLVVLGYVKDKQNYCSVGWIFLSAISGAILLSSLVLCPISHMDMRDNIVKYHAIKETINQSRQNDGIERAALVNQISIINATIASYQYWNNTLLDIYIPDEVMELEMLK